MRVESLQPHTLSIIIAKRVGRDPAVFKPAENTFNGRQDASHLLHMVCDKIDYASLFLNSRDGDKYTLQLEICRMAVRLWYGDEIDNETLSRIMSAQGVGYFVDNLVKSRLPLGMSPRTLGLRRVNI